MNTCADAGVTARRSSPVGGALGAGLRAIVRVRGVSDAVAERRVRRSRTE